jgi:cis-3-alkyl-4-acyloxetan-2-one decarboxylase
VERLPAPPLPDWIERQLPPGTRRFLLDVGGYRMHVTEAGEGHPVLLLHGNPTWGFLYRKVAAALAGDRLRLVMPDLIGLGFSDRPRSASEHTLDAHARWLGALVDGLALRDFVFVGHDWGGPIGLRALADRPAAARGLVILNTVVSPPREGFRPTRFHRFSRLALVSDVAFRLLGFPQNVLHRVQGDPASIHGEVARAYRHPLRRLRDNAAPLALARMVPDGRPGHPSLEPLERVQAFVTSFPGPVAVVWGDRDPVLGRLRKRIEALLPNAVVTRTEAGHFLQEEVPEEIAAAIRDVVSRPGKRSSAPA